ncbi:probable polygalacturonase At1g80170 isoform X2 [Humulus lupulus]|uniref:probable polygalacturonase At1g80170 isoform X2 n=1 Tax=Humulus lupulus TaxID=3486 RepID=UPI002B4167FF|nr:probable polygalacturonase At1g80170 isoform X2 [Humulus lupulus]
MGCFRLCSSSTFVNAIAVFCVVGFWSSQLGSTEGFESLLGSATTRLRPKRVLSLCDFGAKGDGIHNDTKAFINAWDKACSFPVRTTIVVPAGNTYLIHPIYLGGPCRSKVTIRISGTITAPKDPKAWSGLNPRKWLYIHEVNHLTIEGGGTINGMGHEWWSRSCKRNPEKVLQSYHNLRVVSITIQAITFHKCKNLKVKDLMLVDSQQMHMAFTNCIRVLASHLKLVAPGSSPNTDAVHISSSRSVEVNHSIFKTGDDCISIVGNSSQIRIRDISCGPGHGISIGSLGKSKSWSHVHDVTVDGAFLSNTENGVRIKTWQGGSGFASKILFQNVLMENVSNPIIIDQYYCDSQKPCHNQTLAVKVENISFKHIKGTSATEEAIKFTCSNNLPCEGLYLEDVQLLSCIGETTRSFCWEAYGSSLGLVDPPACFSISEGFIKESRLSNSYSHVQSS